MYIEVDIDPTIDIIKEMIDESHDQNEILDHVLETASIEGLLPRLHEVIAEGNTRWLHELAFSRDVYRTAAVLKETHSKDDLVMLIKLLVDAL